MVATAPFVLAAAGLLGLVQAAPLESSVDAPLAPRAVAYKTYKGDGTTAQGWPSTSQWASFDTIWNAHVAYTNGACKYLGVGANSAAENNAMKAAIKQVGTDSGLDARFILAAVFQESSGCVRVKTSYSTNEGYRNPGLLQCFNGKHTCNDPKAGVSLRTPCPDDQIKGMITDGATDVSKYYKGALLYNSGVMPESGNLGKGRSNPCYSSDIANRLMGWSADSSPCNRNTVGN
ncbi:hypothetical protein V2G26_015571 [Clonostachys chloroleuca]